MLRFFFSSNKYFIYSFSLFILIFIALCYYFFVEEKEHERRENRIMLQTLARIKSTEILQWYKERTSDAAFLGSSGYLKQLVSDYRRSDSARLAGSVESIYKNHDYKNIFVIDKNYKVIISLNSSGNLLYDGDSVRSSITKKRIVLSNFYLNPADSKVDLDIYVPLYENEKLLSVIVLKIDPDKIFFPLIQNWYIPNSSGESFLIYKDKGNVVFINKLKFNDSSPLTLKLPIDQKELPAAAAVNGYTGILEGTDYRGERVLADTRQITGTPWFLVTKQDLSEIFLPVTNRLSFNLILLFIVFSLGGIGLFYFLSRENFKQSMKVIESESRLRTIIDNSESIVWLKDLQGRFLIINEYLEKLIGKTGDRIIGHTVHDLFGSNLADEYVKNDMQVLSTGEKKVFEEKILHPDGFHDYYVIKFPFRSSSQKMVALGGVGIDISVRKKIEEQNRKLSIAIQQSPSSIIITNDRGEIEYVNPKFTQVTGYSFGEAVGNNPRILKSGEFNKEQYKDLWDTIKSGSEWRGEFHNRKKNGELFWEMASISPIKDDSGNITHFIAVKEDITEAKLAQESLKKMTTELIQKNRNLEQFTYIVSHNLRSPVANILGVADSLQYIELEGKEREFLMNGLFSSVKKLDEVIGDLNTILQVKSDLTEKKEPVYFEELLENIRDSISNIIEKENVIITYDFTEADKLYSIKSYLYSIFFNLVTNSIKYKQHDAPPVIHIKSCRDKDKVQLIFRDNGLGMDLRKRGDQVFGLYKRFHTHTDGKGMGLFMTKMQVEALGGTISLSSEPGRGTEFKIEFDSGSE